MIMSARFQGKETPSLNGSEDDFIFFNSKELLLLHLLVISSLLAPSLFFSFPPGFQHRC